MRALRALISLIFGTALSLPALALAQVTEIYKCVDSGGRPLYTSDKKDTAGKKCELVSREINVVPATKLPTRIVKQSPEGFPKESPATRATAKERQRDILEKELADEQQKLAQARQELAEQESVRASDGSSASSYSKDQDRIQRYRDNVDLHQKNIEALRRELAR